MSVGNRVFLQRELPDMELVKRYQRLPAANVADTMSRSCALIQEIHLIRVLTADYGRPGAHS